MTGKYSRRDRRVLAEAQKTRSGGRQCVITGSVDAGRFKASYLVCRGRRRGRRRRGLTNVSKPTTWRMLISGCIYLKCLVLSRPLQYRGTQKTFRRFEPLATEKSGQDADGSKTHNSTSRGLLCVCVSVCLRKWFSLSFVHLCRPPAPPPSPPSTSAHTVPPSQLCLFRLNSKTSCGDPCLTVYKHSVCGNRRTHARHTHRQPHKSCVMNCDKILRRVVLLV